MAAAPQLKTPSSPAPAASSRAPAPLGLLVSPGRLAELKAMVPAALDLTGLSPSDIIARAQTMPLVLEQRVTGVDQIVLSLAVERPNASLIVISDHLPAHMIRALMKLPTSDILPEGAGGAEILAAADQLRSTQTGQGAAHSAVCWAFRGAVGGAGVSTLTIETAYDIARRSGPGKTCLIDLNVADGMVTSFLDCVPKFDLGALSDAPDRLDPLLLSAWCHEHDSGLKIVAAKRNPDADALASEAAVLRLLDVACASFDYVLVDMPRHMRPWTKAVLAAADETIIISELTVPSLHAAADMCRDIDSWRADGSPTRLVLNRMFAKKRFRAEFAVDRAEAAIERAIDATITSDWDAARTAVNMGRPIAEVKPKSPIVGDVHTLVGRWMPQLAQAAAPQKMKARA